MTPHRNTRRAQREAAEWIAKLASGTSSPATIAAFEAWRMSSDERARAYDYMSALSAATSTLDHLKALEPLHAASDVSPRLRTARRGLSFPQIMPRWGIASCMAMFALALCWFALLGSPSTQRFATGRGELRDVMLVDGSRINLSPETELKVVYSKHAREISLVRGEALFDVEHDPSRPFTVAAGNTIVRAVGTRFTVLAAPRSMKVAVFEGVVAVKPAAGGTPVKDARVTAGEIFTVRANRQVERAALPPMERTAPWLDGYLEFSDERLDRIVSEANRFGTGSIVIADPSLAELRVTTVFRTGDLKGLARNLELVLPVETTTDRNEKIIIRRRQF